MIRKEGQRAWPEKGGQNAMARLMARRGWPERDGQKGMASEWMARKVWPELKGQQGFAKIGKGWPEMNEQRWPEWDGRKGWPERDGQKGLPRWRARKERHRG